MNLGKLPCRISLLFCEMCMECKQYRVAFSNEGDKRATKPLEIIYFDVCGPIRTTFIGSARYFVTFIDDLLKNICLYALRTKAKCFERVEDFKAIVRMQSWYKINAFRSNNSGKFICKVFKWL